MVQQPVATLPELVEGADKKAVDNVSYMRWLRQAQPTRTTLPEHLP